MLPRLLAALLCIAIPAAAAPPLRIAAAADLKWALEEIKTAFEKERPGSTCALTFSSSGALYAQLQQRAPFDVFLSADAEYPRGLARLGLGDAGGAFSYAVGHLVLWAPKDSPLPVAAKGLEALKDPRVKRVALANPKTAPYGRAAEASLKAAGLYEALRGKLVLGDNVAQTAQFVQTGNADLGLIARSLARSPQLREGQCFDVPGALHPPLEQAGLVLAWAQDPAAARAFRDFLRGPKGQAILQAHGFAPPEK